ncbi:uncharacterized protein [Taeniopygia guttata]|uniref:uncharacterized protein n=1 Tax=Taeniopygia guttata TaxID=59729 RepID=UPI003BB8F708
MICGQWSIEFKLRDFYLAIARPLELGATECSVDAMHPGIWEQCTATLAGETKSSGSGESPKAQGEVEKAPRKAIGKQETRSAARMRLLVRPGLGTGAEAQTVPEDSPPGNGDPGGLGATPPSPDQSPNLAAEAPRRTPAAKNPQKTPAAKKPRETAASRSVPPPPPVRDPLSEAQRRAERFWQELAGEARIAEAAAQAETLTVRPRCRFKNGTGRRRGGRGPGNLGAKTRTPRDFRGAPCYVNAGILLNSVCLNHEAFFFMACSGDWQENEHCL